MSNRHLFEQEDVTGDGRNWFARESKWLKFKRVYLELGFKVRITGGVFFTHEIDCTKEDFDAILDLIKY